MSLTRNIIFAAAAAITIVGASATINSTTAEAGTNSERLNTCAWYKSKAMANGRSGYLGEADHYWFLYRECMHYRID